MSLYGKTWLDPQASSRCIVQGTVGYRPTLVRESGLTNALYLEVLL